MQRNSTVKKKQGLIAIQARIEQELLDRIDHERMISGQCSRAVIIRKALLDRYRKTVQSEVA